MSEISSQNSFYRSTSSSAKLGGLLSLVFAVLVFYWSLGDSPMRIILGVILAVLWMGAGLAALSKHHLVLCPLCLQENPMTSGTVFKCSVCKLTSAVNDAGAHQVVTANPESIESAKNIGTLTVPPPPNAWGVGVGCAGVTLAILFFLAPSASSDSSQATPPVPEASISEISVAHKLACINADQMVSPSDHSVASFQTILNEIRRKRPTETEEHLADVTVAGWNEVKKREKISLLTFMQKVSRL